MSRKISEILDLKGNDVWCISADAKVFEALEIMSDKNVGALVVLDGGQVAGVFSERDYSSKVEVCGHSSRTTNVRQVMLADATCVTPETSVDEAMEIVTNSRRRHLPVLLDGKLVGLASIGDLVKASLDEKDLAIQELKGYIKGEK